MKRPDRHQQILRKPLVCAVTPTLVLVMAALPGRGLCCPAACTCEGNASDCSGLDLPSLTPILPLLDGDCVTLRLPRNKLSTLAPGDLSRLTRLEVLDLSRNRLSGLPPGVFSQAGGLRWLNLSANLLGARLSPVDTDGGEDGARGLSGEAFEGLRRLRGLDLSSNGLPRLPGGLLDHLRSLRWLSLAGNRLAALERAAFEPLTGLGQLLLAGNPWECGCKMAAFKHWMEWMLYRDGRVDAVTCSLPRSLLGRDVRGLPAEMFAHCRVPQSDRGRPQCAPGGPDECVRRRPRPAGARRAPGTQVVAGVVCGTVCVMMAVAAAYGCVYASLMARYQERPKTRGRPPVARSGAGGRPRDGEPPEDAPPQEARVEHGYRISSF